MRLRRLARRVSSSSTNDLLACLVSLFVDSSATFIRRTNVSSPPTSWPARTAEASCARGDTPAPAGCGPATAVASCVPAAAAAGPVATPTCWCPGGCCRAADAVEVVGEALLAAAAGEGHRPIAARLGRPAATVRGWLRRFVARVEQTLQQAMRCLIRFDLDVVRIEPDPAASPVQTALAILGAAAAVERRLRAPARSPWQLISSLCSGRLLANTSCPYPPPE
jgi:hypothetical protein